jgi:acyl-CoA thioesterase FadM
MKWTEHYKINAHDVDYNNIVSATGILRYMQDTANCNMEGQRPSYNELFESGRAFVLSRMRMSIYGILRSHDEVDVSTWACESSGASFKRCFSVEKDGMKIAEAVSVWALIDRNAGRLVRVSDFENNYCTDEMVELDLPPRFRIPQDVNLTLVGERTVEYQDVDMNRHINNTRYADFACDALKMEAVEKGKFVRELQIGFLAECHAGEELILSAGMEDNRGFVRGNGADGTPRFEALLAFGT